jgi:hypothetical protein
MAEPKNTDTIHLYRQRIGDTDKFRVLQEFTPVGKPEQHSYEADDQMHIPVIVPTGPGQGVPKTVDFPIHFKIENAGNFVDAFDRYEASLARETAVQRPQAEKALQAQGLMLQQPQGRIITSASGPLPPPPGAERGVEFRPKGKR